MLSLVQGRGSLKAAVQRVAKAWEAGEYGFQQVPQWPLSTPGASSLPQSHQSLLRVKKQQHFFSQKPGLGVLGHSQCG